MINPDGSLTTVLAMGRDIGEVGAFAPTEDNLTPAHETLLTDVAVNPQRYEAFTT